MSRCCPARWPFQSGASRMIVRTRGVSSTTSSTVAICQVRGWEVTRFVTGVRWAVRGKDAGSVRIHCDTDETEDAAFAPSRAARSHKAGRASASLVAAVPLFPPRVAVEVVAVGLPEPGLVVLAELEAAHPLGALPEVEVRDQES